jgi:PAS domain S-box-containing protein
MRGRGNRYQQKNQTLIFKKLISAMKDGFTILDINGIHIDVNPAFCVMTGYSKSELVGSGPPHMYWPEEERAKIEAAFNNSIRGEFKEHELVFKKKDGKRFPVIVSPSWVKDEDGKVMVVFATVKDITELKKTESALKENMYLLRNVIDTDPNIVFVIDEYGKIIFVNQALADFYGTEIKEIEGLLHADVQKKFAMSMHELKRWLKDDHRALKAGKLIEFVEFSHNRAGQGDWYRTRKLPLTLSSGKNAVLVISENVSSLVELEKDLRVSEEKYRTMISSMNDAVAIHEIIYDEAGKPIDFVIQEVNPAYENQTGISADRVKGKKVSEIFGTAPFLNTYDKVVNTGLPIYFEKYFPPLERFFRISAFSFGKPNFVTVFRDITAHKKAEEARRESEIKYKTLFENANDGIFLLEKNLFVECNTQVLKMFGGDRDTILGRRPYEVSPTIQPDGSNSKEKAKAIIAEALEGRPQNFEWRHLRSDGKPFDVRVSLNKVEIEKKTYLQAIIHDITAKKKAEEEILRKNVQLEEKTIAFREAIEQVRLEKERIETQIQANVEHLILPLLNKMRERGSQLDSLYLDLLQENIKSMTSGFAREITEKEKSLTQREIEICNMIVSGFATKEIAGSLNISARTVETHRANIRKKLGIKKRMNLATYLKTLKNYVQS